MYKHKNRIQLIIATIVSTWKVYIPVKWYNVDLPCVENWCTLYKYVKRNKIEEGHVSIFYLNNYMRYKNKKFIQLPTNISLQDHNFCL